MSDSKYLQDQAEAAKDAMGRAWTEFVTGMGKSADPRQWAKAHPWITMASATVAGFAAASTLVPSKEEQALKKLAAIERALHIDGRPKRETNGDGAKEPKEGFLTRLMKEAFAAAGPVLAIVSLPVQRMYVYRNGVLIGVTTVSTGTKGRETPTGVFTVLQKKVKHNSNLYNNAPMPYMQRLTWDGIAMHAGQLPGYAASHGCVRLPMGFAKLLYRVTKLGMTVVITDQQAVPRVAPTPDLLESAAETAAAVQGAWTWTPEKSPTGPVSLILSGADRRLVVLRNGVLIGSAPVEIVRAGRRAGA